VKMAEYLARENDYKKCCLMEQDSLQELERKVFKIVEQIPVKHGQFVAPLMEKCKETFGKEEHFDDLAAWDVFENQNKEHFLRQVEPLVQSENNHPNEELFNCFEDFHIKNLEIYHKVPIPQQKRLRRASTIIGLAKRDFAVRGSWSVSAAGNLIEFDDKQHKALSVFDLSVCKLGPLAPDEANLWGYFPLLGRKSHDPTDKKKDGRRKDYKFRAAWRDAQELYNVLRGYCEGSINIPEVLSASGDTDVTVHAPG